MKPVRLSAPFTGETRLSRLCHSSYPSVKVCRSCLSLQSEKKTNSPEMEVRWSQVGWCWVVAAQWASHPGREAGLRCLTHLPHSKDSHHLLLYSSRTVQQLAHGLKLYFHWYHLLATSWTQLQLLLPVSHRTLTLFLHAHTHTHECTGDVIRPYTFYLHEWINNELNKTDSTWGKKGRRASPVAW